MSYLVQPMDLPIDPVDFPGTPEWCDQQRERKERLEAQREYLYDLQLWEEQYLHRPAGHA